MENTFLQKLNLSDEPNIKIKEKNSMKYRIIKGTDSTHEYSSLILSEPEGKILSYVPQPIPAPEFMTRYPITDDRVASEAIEGTLITLFWDERIQQWEIGTKGAVGGNYWFYRTKYPCIHESSREQSTFRQMFLDAIGREIEEIALPTGSDDEMYCYHFVLQHPENHIVFDIEHPKIHLVSVFRINPQNEIKAVSEDTYKNWVNESPMKDVIYFPSQQDIDWNAPFSPTSSYPMGIMITHKNGERTCIENEEYLKLKELRGNHPNLQYQYLVLRQEGRVHDFLSYFPRYKELFYYFYIQYEDFITQLHQSYVSYYIQKTGNHISKRYFSLIHKLHHTVYVPSLSTKKIIMKRGVIQTHIQEISPKQVIYYLNYRE
jgi:hypothetical protein